MEHREEELIRQHLTHDEELRALYAEHQELEQNSKSLEINST